jgi:hypothetical protein
MGTDTSAKAKLALKINGRIQERTGFDGGAPVLPGFEARSAFVF